MTGRGAPPKTASGLREDLVRLGVANGMTLIVHSSLRSIGWVDGGAAAVVRALLESVGAGGTLVMPCATPDCADPATWTHRKVPEERLSEARDGLSSFDPRTTPTSMGAVPETFRTWPHALRSNHPLESICALGPAASAITRDHPLAFSEGEGGPFGRLHELGSWILLIGVGFNRCTALHFAESLVEKRRVTTVRLPVLEDGRRQWREVPNVADDNDTHFPIIGDEYLKTGSARVGSVGDAQSTLFPMPDLVDVAVRYFRAAL